MSCLAAWLVCLHPACSQPPGADAWVVRLGLPRCASPAARRSLHRPPPLIADLMPSLMILRSCQVHLAGLLHPVLRMDPHLPVEAVAAGEPPLPD